MIRRFALIIYLIIFDCYIPQALANGNQINIIGRGTSSCGEWTSVRRDPDSLEANLDEQWALGFLSGVAFAGPSYANPLNGTDAYGVWAWLDNYCSANPLKEIVDATGAFFHAHPN